MQKDEIISAQAILLPASGKPIGPDDLITAENISQYEPSQESVAEASRLFRSLGFEVGWMVGTSFSITAPVAVFINVFKARLRRNKRGGIECLDKEGKGGLELPLRSLPKELSQHLDTVTFTEPPDFGPTDF